MIYNLGKETRELRELKNLRRSSSLWNFKSPKAKTVYYIQNNRSVLKIEWNESIK